jgi:hypothetical protein
MKALRTSYNATITLTCISRINSCIYCGGNVSSFKTRLWICEDIIAAGSIDFAQLLRAN